MRLLIIVVTFLLPLRLAAAELPPLRAFIEPEQFRNPKLSPHGASLAVVGVRNYIDMVAVIDLATFKAVPVATLPNARLLNYWWKSESQLLLLVDFWQDGAGFQLLDLKTGKSRALRRLNFQGGSIVNPLIDDPDHMLVSTYTYAYAPSGVDLRRLNLRTEKLEMLTKNPGNVTRWLTNRAGSTMAGLGRLDDRWFMLVPEPSKKTPWRRIDLGDRDVPDFWPIAIYTDQRSILGLDYSAGNTAVAAVWDPAHDRKQVIWRSDDVDADAILVWGDDETRPRAVAYETDRPRYHFIAEDDGALATQIDALLPDCTNAIVSMSADESKMVIQSYSDTVVSNYHLLDRTNGLLKPLGSAHPGLHSARMAPIRHFTFTNRSGMNITGQIHLPRDAAGPCRAIILTTDTSLTTGTSLTTRNRRNFQPYYQLLASRGYAVITINQRGTAGFGSSFEQAGDQQIATGMPDDIADGLDWLIREGLVDKRRVAILGGRKGGILALHTLVRHPELFSAWINIDTPMSPHFLEVGDVVFGRHSEKSRLARIGGERQTAEYLRTLDPKQLLPAVRVPAFCYYTRDPRDNSLVNDGSVAQRHFEKSGLPQVFLQSPSAQTSFDTRKDFEQAGDDETERVYAELLRFLDRHLQ